MAARKWRTTNSSSPNPAAEKVVSKMDAGAHARHKGRLTATVMTLTKLVSGADLPYPRDQDDPDDVINKGVQVAYRVERGGKPVTNWSPASVEITDATGNRTTINYGPGGNQVRWNGDEAAFTYQNGLWPDEPAWKVRMEMTQNSDFSSDEQWTAENIPVVPGSQQSFNSLTVGWRARRFWRTWCRVRTWCRTRNRHPAGRSHPLRRNRLERPPYQGFSGGAVHESAGEAGGSAGECCLSAAADRVDDSNPAGDHELQRDATGEWGVNGAQTADDGMRLSLAKVTDGQGGEIPHPIIPARPDLTGTDADSIPPSATRCVTPAALPTSTHHRPAQKPVLRVHREAGKGVRRIKPKHFRHENKNHPLSVLVIVIAGLAAGGYWVDVAAAGHRLQR